MKQSDPTLNQTQVDILIITYRFRYVSAPLLARLRKTHVTTARASLENLYQKKLLNKKYDKSYKLLGKPAAYSLNPKGVKAVANYTDINEKYGHSMYKNASASENFADQNLNILAAYLSLEENYGNTFSIYTRAETIDFEDDFPKTLPNLFLKRNDSSNELPDYYMLDIIPGTQKNVLYKKIEMYIDHLESGDWQEDEHPTVLLVLENSYIEDVARKMFEERKDSRFIEDDEILLMTTTRKAIVAALTTSIWSIDTEHLLSL